MEPGTDIYTDDTANEQSKYLQNTIKKSDTESDLTFKNSKQQNVKTIVLKDEGNRKRQVKG